ncbi:MAG: prepilin-type N-terminal cleavage/methylation domain-containing protein [Kiritimatiellia bacterium]
MPPSRSGFHDPRRAGFTLVELVVVIVVLFLLLISIAPIRPAGALQAAKANSLLQQGSQMVKALLARDIQEDLGGSLYPGATNAITFATSTDYFKYVIEQKVIPEHDFSLFGGAGASLAKTLDASRFNATNNAWSVVADTTTTKNDRTPFLISRNLVLPGNRLPDGTLGLKGENLAALLKSTPDRLLSFSRQYLVVITRSASGNAVHAAKDLGPGKAHLLNPTAHRLPVLRP